MITVHNAYTVQEIAEFLDVPLGGDIRVNDTPAQKDTKVYENFTVSWNLETAEEPTVEDWLDEDENRQYDGYEAAVSKKEQTERVVSEQKITIQENGGQQPMENKEAEPEPAPAPKLPRPMSVLVNKMPITMNGKADYVFVDVFDYINFDLKASAGRSIVTMLNGRPAQYMENLNDGDIIEIYWKSL